MAAADVRVLTLRLGAQSTELVSCELSHSRNRRREQFTAAELYDKPGPGREYRDECDASSVPILHIG